MPHLPLAVQNSFEAVRTYRCASVSLGTYLTELSTSLAGLSGRGQLHAGDLEDDPGGLEGRGGLVDRDRR